MLRGLAADLADLRDRAVGFLLRPVVLGLRRSVVSIALLLRVRHQIVEPCHSDTVSAGTDMACASRVPQCR